MMDPKYIALMNQELDGENSPDQSRVLAEFLAVDADSRQYFQELQEALQIFQIVDLLDPPAGLADLVNEAVQGADRARTVTGAPTKAPSKWRGIFQPNRAVTFATGALFGLIVFVGLAELKPGGQDGRFDWDRGTATSTVDPSDRIRAAGLAIELPGVRGQVSVMGRDPGTLLRLEITADEPVIVRINHGEALTCDGYHATYAENYSLLTSEQSTELQHQGDGDYYFLFGHPEGSGAVLEITVQTAGGQEAVLSVPTEIR
jgi:hypothetical protein